MTADPHSPTTAGPTPPSPGGAVSAAAADAQTKVTDAASTAQAKVTDATATAQAKVADAQAAVTDKPEVQVGLAFAGAFLAAKVLKLLGGGR